MAHKVLLRKAGWQQTLTKAPKSDQTREPDEPRRAQAVWSEGLMFIIQPMPNSVPVPVGVPHISFDSGFSTVPPSASCPRTAQLHLVVTVQDQPDALALRYSPAGRDVRGHEREDRAVEAVRA